MSLLHPALLYGLGLAAVPVVLHLLMRAKPKQLDFPALRLLETIRKQNTQRMRLRHIGLLLLRMLVLVLLVLAVARPTLPAANYQLTAGDWGRLGAVLLLTGAAYLLGKRFWVQPVAQRQAQLQRQSWLTRSVWGTLILLLLLLVAWPYQQRVYSQIRSPGEQLPLNVPVSAVLLFDVSASMGYQHENQTRLERAQELALQQVRNFPSGSRVAIAENKNNRALNFLNDMNAAVTRLQRTDAWKPEEATQTLNDHVLAAIQLQRQHRAEILAEGDGGAETEEQDRYLREIYIYTDGLRSAWSLENAERLRSEMEQVPWLRCYLIDTGVESPTNYSLEGLSLSRERAVQGSVIRVGGEVWNQSPAPLDATVELLIEDSAGIAVKRDQQTLRVEPGEATQVTFSFTENRLGVVQGELRLASTDPLKVDDRLPWTIRYEPRPRLVIVAEEPEEAFVWQQALAPDALVERGTSSYTVEVINSQELFQLLNPGPAARENESAPPAVIYLLNVARLTPAAWESLQKYVFAGGGVGVICGHSRIDVANYRNARQEEWLPGLPTVHSRANPLLSLEVTRSDHPIFQYLKRLEALTPFSSAGIRRYWKSDLSAESQVLATFQDEERTPALMTRNYGQGRVALFTTAVDLKDAAEQRNWSDLARLGWIYAAWADQLTRYLRAEETVRLNRQVGETMLLTVADSLTGREGLMQLPGLRQSKITVPFRGPFWQVTSRQSQASRAELNALNGSESLAADRVGNYRVLFPETSQSAYGFSLQLSETETQLQSLSHAELDELFGPDRWQLSRSYEELERTVLLGRIGQEAYPFLVTLLVVFFLSEHLVANLFYRDGQR